MMRLRTEIVMALVGAVWAAAAAAGPVLGDVNGDWAVDAVDVQRTVNGVLGVSVGLSADVNGDGSLDAVDIQLAVNGALGIAVAAADLSGATLVVRGGTLPPAEAQAAIVLQEELEKRTGIRWPIATAWPATGPVVALLSGDGDPGWGRPVPRRSGTDLPESRTDGFRIYATPGAEAVVWVQGADARGALYGAGALLRALDWAEGAVSLPHVFHWAAAPAVPLRGHQLGYRNTANSYDAWTLAEYEQYIRDLAVFGVNAIENIPFEADGSSVHFPLPPSEMRWRLSELCDRYGLDYWVWTPAPDLTNPTARSTALNQHAAFYAECPRLDGVFVPGGDPGDNPPELLLPFLADIAMRLHAEHPEAGVWVSVQGFDFDRLDAFFELLERDEPEWLAGLVFGPWTKITLAELRAHTPARYPIRRYPDITHTVRCQYPVDGWDRAFAHTLGREPVNPRPVAQAHIHNALMAHADGFIAYSDGAHDDVNKVVWAARGWNPGVPVEAVLREYAAYFFGPGVAGEAAVGIAALEANWSGPLADNDGVDATLSRWQGLEAAHPELAANWRWQLCLLRAYYDAYLRVRLAAESQWEAYARDRLGQAAALGADAAMAQAETQLARATGEPAAPALRARIVALCEALFTSVGLQTSVNPPYSASNSERGCVLDFIDHPLNDRNWLEAEFGRVRGLPNETAKRDAITAILDWDDPGPGGFYDDLGNPQRQPHLVQQAAFEDDPGRVVSTQTEYAWNRFSSRLAAQDQAQTLFGQPLEMRYTGLQPGAGYRLRVLYDGRFRATMQLRANGTTLIHGPVAQANPTAVMAFDIPQHLTQGGTLDFAWELVAGRGCQVAEVWLERR